MLEVKRQLNAKAIAQQVGSGSGGGSTGHTYSTTAQKVGKWTDNKDVYEIVIHLESAYEPKPEGTDFPEAVQTFLNGIDNIISCQGVGSKTCVDIGIEYASSKWTGYTAVGWSITDLIFTYTVAPTP